MDDLIIQDEDEVEDEEPSNSQMALDFQSSFMMRHDFDGCLSEFISNMIRKISRRKTASLTAF